MNLFSLLFVMGTLLLGAVADPAHGNPPRSAAGSAATSKKAPPARQVLWRGSFEQAFGEAGDRNLPVLVAINMDFERANDELARETYRSAMFIELADGLVPLVASAFQHEEQAVEEGGIRRRVCSRFGSISCEEHLAVERRVRELLLGGIELVDSPQHILLTPRREVILSRKWHLSGEALCRLIRDSLRKAREEAESRAGSLVRQAGTGNAKKAGAAYEELRPLLEGLSAECVFDVIQKRASVASRASLVRHLAAPGTAESKALPMFLKDSSATVRRLAVDGLAPKAKTTAREALKSRLDVEKDPNVRDALRAVLAK